MDNKQTLNLDKIFQWFKEGEKKRDDWLIGTEHEKFLFHRDGLRPVAYDGDHGIEAMLHALCKAIGDKATPITENGKIIGLKDGDGGSVWAGNWNYPGHPWLISMKLARKRGAICAI